MHTIYRTREANIDVVSPASAGVDVKLVRNCMNPAKTRMRSNMGKMADPTRTFCQPVGERYHVGCHPNEWNSYGSGIDRKQFKP